MKLQIRHARVQYGADIIIDDINFEIHDREKIAVVGRNGCGKTTLLKLISGELEISNPDSDESCAFNIAGGVTIGTLKQINFEDKEITAEEEIKKVFRPIIECKARMEEIEALLGGEQIHNTPEEAEEDFTQANASGFEGKYASKNTSLEVENLTKTINTDSGENNTSKEVEKLLKEYDSLQKRFDALDGYSYEREMKVMFQSFGFSLEDLKKPMGTFSGGQQTKIAFMKLLLSKPDVLLLDEPTNHLDLPTIMWLENYLKNYKSAVVIVSHDRAFLDGIVSVTYEIEYHRITRYSGNYTAFVRQKEEALAKQ
ncbi:MAG: ABC-F family ATP-binding cassette domain-containing protein, partial [Parasporobacterium sp.]|nr:ABC-F family ATP-binding cassette domain-containing protein [Parasporobacterium sp.]